VNKKGYLAVVIGVALGAASVACLTPKAEGQRTAASKAKAARTVWGDPDLRGVWTGSSITPLERAEEFAGREFLTEAETAAVEERAARDRVDRPPRPGDPGTYNQIWFDPASKVVPTRRTSLIVDPPDGRLPFTEEGRRHQTRSSARYGVGPRDSWLDLDTGERCLTDGLPLYWTGYNNNYQIFQSRDYVVILAEMFRDRRIIPLDGRSHGNIPQWLGDSRGRWEGDTLVVETNGLRDDTWLDRKGSPMTDAATLTERFRRVNYGRLEIDVTVNDPKAYTRPWTVTLTQLIVLNTELLDYHCLDNEKDAKHLVGK